MLITLQITKALKHYKSYNKIYFDYYIVQKSLYYLYYPDTDSFEFIYIVKYKYVVISLVLIPSAINFNNTFS